MAIVVRFAIHEQRAGQVIDAYQWLSAHFSSKKDDAIGDAVDKVLFGRFFVLALSTSSFSLVG